MDPAWLPAFPGLERPRQSDEWVYSTISNIQSGTPEYDTFLVGTELEVILEHQFACDPLTGGPVDLSKWDDFTNHLKRALKRRGLECTVPDNLPDYTTWLLTEDASIAQSRSSPQWGIEFVSPISDSVVQQWHGEYTKLWECLEKDFRIINSDLCGTHVHVSPMVIPGPSDPFRDRGFFSRGAMASLKKIAKAVVYFERCVDSLMPPHRLNCKYCRSNRYNPKLRPHQMNTIFQ
jgi:hypothetical protein